jgi:hypothetical protein
VGVENDSTTEFGGGAGDVGVDADSWNAPKEIFAGGNLVFKFPLDSVGEAEMNEEFRLKLTSDSVAASVQVKVNGIDMGTELVQPNGEVYWFVPAKCFLSGCTNTLLVTRTDNGLGAMKIDALALGGSLQYGKRNNSATEFVREYDASGAFDLIGGNWFDGRRIIYGQGASAGNLQYTNIVVKFDVPERMCARYKWRLKWRLLKNGGNSYRLNPCLNGKSLGVFPIDSEECEVELDDGDIHSENELSLINVGGADRKGGALVDYVRISIWKRFGLAVSIR